jgi:hypothetical protein
MSVHGPSGRQLGDDALPALDRLCNRTSLSWRVTKPTHTLEHIYVCTNADSGTRQSRDQAKNFCHFS